MQLRNMELRSGLNPFVFRAYYCDAGDDYPVLCEGLNPFVFMAYYCAVVQAAVVDEKRSQSLCFQGVLLRQGERVHPLAAVSQSLCFQCVLLRPELVGGARGAKVSIPLFSGRITAENSRIH